MKWTQHLNKYSRKHSWDLWNRDYKRQWRWWIVFFWAPEVGLVRPASFTLVIYWDLCNGAYKRQQLWLYHFSPRRRTGNISPLHISVNFQDTIFIHGDRRFMGATTSSSGWLRVRWIIIFSDLKALVYNSNRALSESACNSVSYASTLTDSKIGRASCRERV